MLVFYMVFDDKWKDNINNEFKWVEFQNPTQITLDEFNDRWVETLDTPWNICIIWSGGIWDKARELIRHESVLNEVGFKIPRTLVLSEDVLYDLVEKLGLSGDLDNLYRAFVNKYWFKEQRLTKEFIKAWKKIYSYFDWEELMVRSSWEWDSIWTGIYETISPDIVRGIYDEKPINPKVVIGDIIKVLSSFFSKDWNTYREQIKVWEGFGIILQPVIWQRIKKNWWEHYIPVLSGNGYTSTENDNMPTLTLKTGFWGWVDGKGLNNMKKDIFMKEWKWRSGWFWTLWEIYRDRWGWQISNEKELEMDDCLKFDQEFRDIKFDTLFNMLEELEQKTWKSQYIEFASKEEDGKLSYYITQISNIEKWNLDIIDFSQFNNPMISADMITGTGEKICEHILHCVNEAHFSKLNTFNKTNDNYILVLAAHLVTSWWRGVSIPFSYYSNAGVILVEWAHKLGWDLPSHFRGLMDGTWKFLGQLTNSPYINDAWNSDHMLKSSWKYRVYSSEKQQKLVITEEK